MSPLPANQAVPQFEDHELSILQQAIPDNVKHMTADMLAFWRALPNLIAEGEEGRIALVHGGVIISLFDSLAEATQMGYDQFGRDNFVTPRVKALELHRIRQFLAASV